MVSALAYSQADKSYDVYCMVTYNIESKAVIVFDDDNKVICDENLKEIKFSSLPALLTYLSKKGWTYVWQDEVKVLSIRCPRILLKKSVTDDSQAFENLYLKDMIKKK